MRLQITIVLFVIGCLAMPASSDAQESKYSDLPFGVTSFGAAVDGDWLYLYGGNKARAHTYHREGQNNRVLRLNLREGGDWEEVTQSIHVQGLAMVAYEGKLIRIGGLMALNDEDEEARLVSTNEVASFDTATKEWTDLPPLPEPRSSFDAVVSNGVVYVIGGWTLKAGEEIWLDTAWRLDLKRDELKWESIAEAPFERRANAVAEWNGKIYTVGGMMSSGSTTTEVSIYDPKSDEWLVGPELPGEDMDGFGCAAYRVGDRLIVSTINGLFLKLSSDGTQWEELESPADGRFFHRLLPIGDDRAVLVGGTSMRSGKQLEVVVASVD